MVTIMLINRVTPSLPQLQPLSREPPIWVRIKVGVCWNMPPQLRPTDGRMVGAGHQLQIGLTKHSARGQASATVSDALQVAFTTPSASTASEASSGRVPD